MKFVRQRDSHDCGVACLVMVCQHYGRHVSLERTRQLCHIKRTGVSLLGISEAAEIMGLRTQGVLCDLGSLQELNSSHKCNRPVKPQISMPKLANAYSLGVK